MTTWGGMSAVRPVMIQSISNCFFICKNSWFFQQSRSVCIVKWKFPEYHWLNFLWGLSDMKEGYIPQHQSPTSVIWLLNLLQCFQTTFSFVAAWIPTWKYANKWQMLFKSNSGIFLSVVPHSLKYELDSVT